MNDKANGSFVMNSVSSISEMSNDGGLQSSNTPSDTDSNSNSGSLFSRQYPDESSSSSDESKENTPTLLNNGNMTSQNFSPNVEEMHSFSKRQTFKIFPETLKCQPKITRKDSIDLATDEEKANSDDEWFMGKFRLTHKSQLLDWDKGFERRKYPFPTRRTFVQTCLMKRLAEMRRLGQLKRKAMYDADNDIADDESSSIGIGSDACELTDDEENKTSTLTSEGEPENDITMEESEKDRPGSDGSEMVMQEGEVNEKEINLNDEHDAGDEGIGNIKLTVNRNGITTPDNDDEFNSEASGDASDEDWRKNWFRLGMKTCETPMKHLDHESCYMPDSETGSSSLSDEAADEDGRSSASIMDDLLNDVAANCSGIFDYPEDYEPKEQGSSKRVSICKDADDTDDKEDELIRRRKPGRHRLVFEDNSDEDELIGDGWKSGNIRDHEAHSKQCTEAKISSHTSEGSNFDDPKALLVGWDKFSDNSDKDFLFNEESDGLKEDVMQPTGRVTDDEKYWHDQFMEEGDSSDEEMEVFRKLQNMRKSKKCEYIEEEASLSGDDVGSDEDDNDQLDVYEAEEGDNDELPDNETIREQLQKQWLKQQQDEEDRKLLYWKDQLLIDGDLSSETDRTFRFKLRRTETENVNEKTDHTVVAVETDEVDGEELWKKHREISKWKREATKAGLHGEGVSMKGTNPLLQAASKIIDKSHSSQSQEQTSSPSCKNSLLSHRKSLSQVLNQTKTTLYMASASPVSERANGYIEEHNISKCCTTKSSRDHET